MSAISTVAQVNSAIISGNFTNEQLNAIADAIKFARSQLANQVKFTLVKGSKVKFTSSRNGQTVLGTVDKVNRKYILVRENKPGALVGSIWRVPANMLEAA
jgi:hypothetical protein